MGNATQAGGSRGEGAAAKGPVSLAFLCALLALTDSSCEAANTDCPITDWRTWQRDRVALLEKEGFNPRTIASIVRGTREVAERCQGYFAEEPAARECTENLRAFSRALSIANQPGHTMGLEIEDSRYLATLPDPALLEIPPELHDQRFLKLLDENTPAALDAAVAHLDARNAARPPGGPAWQHFIYTSQHLPTPDKSNAFGRFFVFVPGPSFDRYLQFGLRDDPVNPVPDSVSMVTMQTADPGTGERLARPRAYIEDFWRTRKGGEIAFSTRLAQTGHLENCYECHKQPLLHVVPAKATFDAARWGATLQEVNARMSSYGETELAGLDGRAYGPGVGPLSSPLRTDAFLRSCAGDRVRPESLDHIRSAMGCSRCHDGAFQARLDYPTLLRDLPSGGTLASRYVVTYRKMPPGADLTDDERTALIKCLEHEYYRGFDGQAGILSAWLSQPDCAPKLSSAE